MVLANDADGRTATGRRVAACGGTPQQAARRSRNHPEGCLMQNTGTPAIHGGEDVRHNEVVEVFRRVVGHFEGRTNASTGLNTMYENLLAHVPTDLWIGGKWRKASDNVRFDIIDPATENVITSVASASVDDAKAAVDSAQDAFEGWAGRKPRERAEILRKAYE